LGLVVLTLEQHGVVDIVSHVIFDLCSHLGCGVSRPVAIAWNQILWRLLNFLILTKRLQLRVLGIFYQRSLIDFISNFSI
jgi:hypothetical protein